MSLLKIIEWPAKVLETKSAEVTEFNQELQAFIKNMHATMDHANGIGLAANQVNEAIRAITIYIPFQKDEGNETLEGEIEKPWHNTRYSFVNPVITKKQGKARYLEGCLSFPEIYDYVDRADKITVLAKDEFGKEFEVEADGLFSICLQHEIDHIDGVVFINRMSRLKAQMAKKKLAKKRLLSSNEDHRS